MVNTYREYVCRPTLRWLRKPCVGPSILNFRDDTRPFINEAVRRHWMLYECCKNAVWGWKFSPLSHFSYFLQLEWISIYIGKHSPELRELASSFSVFLNQASKVTCKLMLQLDICHLKCEWKGKKFSQYVNKEQPPRFRIQNPILSIEKHDYHLMITI